MPVFSIAKNNLNKKRLAKALGYVENYWDKLEVKQTTDQKTLIGLPKPYLVPSTEASEGFAYKEMYYWDNFFLVEAMLAAGKVETAKGIVDNLLYMIDKFGLVPNANRYYMLSRSHPPLLTSMILSVHKHTKDKKWLNKAFGLAEAEYRQVWTGKMQPHNRQVFKGLSRHYDINVIHEMAEAESGWDYTPRFDNRCLDFIPVDLNSYLHKYETDMIQIRGPLEEPGEWQLKADARVEAMRKYMWDKQAGLYLDYDFINRRKSQTVSLASYMPLFVGLASSDEAEAARQALNRFETKWGLATTSLDGGMHVAKQWALPNGWAPLHYTVIKGLERYGYYEDAARIAEKWLKLNLKVFDKTGRFFEKYNVLRANAKPAPGVYPDQVGFGWTNAVFLLLAKEYTGD